MPPSDPISSFNFFVLNFFKPGEIFGDSLNCLFLFFELFGSPPLSIVSLFSESDPFLVFFFFDFSLAVSN